MENKTLTMGMLSPVCCRCKHFYAKKPHNVDEYYSCAAFSNIPEIIWKGHSQHVQPITGDHGIQFEEEPTMSMFGMHNHPLTEEESQFYQDHIQLMSW